MNLVVKFSCSNDPFINLQTFGVSPTNEEETFYNWKPANICLDGFLFPDTVFNLSILLVCEKFGTILLKNVEISCGMLNYNVNHILKVQDLEIWYFAYKYYEDDLHLGRISIQQVSVSNFALPLQKDRITCCLNNSCYLGTFQKDFVWLSEQQKGNNEKKEVAWYKEECDLIYPQNKICIIPNYTSSSYNNVCKLPFYLNLKENLLMEFYNFRYYFPSKRSLTVLWQDFATNIDGTKKNCKIIAKRSLNRYKNNAENLRMLDKGIVKIVYKNLGKRVKIVHIIFNINYIKLF